MDFKGLLHLGGKKQFSRDNQGGSNVHFRDLFEIGELRLLKDDLHTLKQLPSLRSIKPSALESRIVRTQRRTP